MENGKHTLSLLSEVFALCKLDKHAAIPDWALASSFFSVTRTLEEVSIICPLKVIPEEVVCDGGWRGLKIEGPFDLLSTGVLVAIAAPLSAAGLSIFAISTYNTDYILLKEYDSEKAIFILSQEGHHIHP